MPKNDKLEDTWKAVKAEQNGMDQPDASEHTLTFARDNFTVARSTSPPAAKSMRWRRRARNG
jgi:hypothetical protein